MINPRKSSQEIERMLGIIPVNRYLDILDFTNFKQIRKRKKTLSEVIERTIMPWEKVADPKTNCKKTKRYADNRQKKIKR